MIMGQLGLSSVTASEGIDPVLLSKDMQDFEGCANLGNGNVVP